ncbi:MAG: tyrosine-type recombinase/integrase [Candidatus Methylumidiphilus sp.]
MAKNEINFTKANFDGLELPEQGKRATYHDTKVNGLQLRISSTGIKTFSLYRWLKGDAKPERVTLGRFPDMTIEQARIESARINADIARGINPMEKKRLDRAEMKFAEFWKEYMDKYSKARKKERTIQEDEKTYRNYLSVLAARKLSKITKQDCQKLHHEIASKTSGATANRALAVLSSALGVAQDWGYMPDNPAKAVKKFKETARDRYIQSDEMMPFWQALLDEPNRDFADFFMVCLLTGQRREGVLSMRWNQVSMERKEWRIPDPKNREPLTVPLIGEVVSLLADRQAKGGEWVFPGTGKTGHLAEPKTAWKRILERAGIADLRIHDLRRTLGSNMAAAGVNTITTARAMGHKTLSMALRYQQLGTDPRRAAIEAGAGSILANAGARETAEVIQLKQARG